MKLLVVDDSLVIRKAIARSLDAQEIAEVLFAEDGERALELFEEHRPELVTMDLTMPRLDGLGAIAAIRALEPEATILVISALNSHRDAIEALRRGACGFLTKPFTAEEVVAAIRQIAEHSSRGRS